MLYREDKRTGKQLSSLGFGCMRFPKKGTSFDLKASSELIYTAIDKGVNYLDTAYIYGNSEATLGQILNHDGWREKVYLATKLPLFLIRSGADFNKYFDKQLERLQTDHIDYYLMHMITSMDMWRQLKAMGIEDWIAAQKKRGRIGSIGFSYHGGRQDFPLILNDYDWEFVQIQYNYLDEYNQAGRSGLELAASKNIPVVIMEPLRGGKLANELPDMAKATFKAADRSKSPAEWGLRWVLNHPEVTTVLSGMSEMAQLEENLRIADTMPPNILTPEELDVYKEVKRSLEAAIKVSCTACGYCMPCPFGVDIPTCFSTYNTAFTDNKAVAQRQYMQNINALGANPRYAGKCKKCGKCTKHCPQEIAIPDRLAEVSKLLEPWWFTSTLKLYSKVMGRKKMDD